jgi:6-pyruvoyltetrahydropterin/6-carboxytetrahydropterin synthase
MKLSAFKEFHFSAAHCLDIDGHRCSNLHGHNYRIRIEVTGPADENGMIIDFSEIKRHVKPLIDQLDHNNINEVFNGNPTTSEMISIWFYDTLKTKIRGISKIEVRETDTCGAVLEIS